MLAACGLDACLCLVYDLGYRSYMVTADQWWHTLSIEALRPAGSVELPLLNGTLGSPLKLPAASLLGLTGFWGCVVDDSWLVRDDMRVCDI